MKFLALFLVEVAALAIFTIGYNVDACRYIAHIVMPTGSKRLGRYLWLGIRYFYSIFLSNNQRQI